MKKSIEKINAIAELTSIGWEFNPHGSDEIRCKCPTKTHKDETPSVDINVKNNRWNCHSCKAKGDIVTFFAYVHGVPRNLVLQEMSTRYDLEDEKEINADAVEKMHEQIGNAGPLLEALRERGITDDMIRAARIGFDKNKITIPVYDQGGRIVNIRRYLPGAPTHLKMQNTTGFGKVRLYQIKDLLEYSNIIVAGGELKALVFKHLLNPLGFGAVSATAGEGSWNPDWNAYFKDKKVWVCMDIDSAGVKSAREIASYLTSVAKEVRIVTLPLDRSKHPKGDINDWVGREGAGPADIIRLLDSSPAYELGALVFDVEKGVRETSLERTVAPDNIGWRLKFEAIVSALDTTPFLVPRDVKVSCDRQQPGCAICPVKRKEPDGDGCVNELVGSTSRGLLEMVNVGTSAQDKAIADALGIPKCGSVKFKVESHYAVTDTRLSAKLSLSSDTGGGNIQQPAFIVGTMPELNSPYLMEGRVYPHPKTQQATLVIDKLSESVDSLTCFKVKEEELTALEVFQPKEWTVDAIKTRLNGLYADIESNVTGIFGRRNLHLVLDLTWHSPLFISYNGQTVNGWINSLICGDSSQGKSETTIRLLRHYGVGERVECKNATVPGLLGGMQQLGNRWFVSWGVIPTHDRRLVALEEIKGASTEVIGKLTDMRSSGIAEIPKIERRRAHARTRLIWISNPRSNRPVASYSFGIECIHELIGSLEDIRRFDIALLVAAGQVSVSQMNATTSVTHSYTSELCRRLILWTWTRTPQQVFVEPDACALIQEFAEKLCEKYTEALPLVDRGTIRHKLARLSASLAARTFSRVGERLIVRLCHVQFIAEFLDSLYRDPVFGYLEYTKAQTALNILADPIRVEKYLKTATKHPKDLVTGLLYQDDITQVDIQDLCEVDKDIAQTIISFFVRMHCLKRRSRASYIKTPEFIGLLKKLQHTIKETPEVDTEAPF